MKCGQHAAFRFTWPGRDESTICVEHAIQLTNVSRAIGLHIQLTPLAYSVRDSIPNKLPICQQEVADAKTYGGKAT